MPRYEFVIHQKSVICTSCEKVFTTPVNKTLPEMSKTLPVDADLHRILPFGATRACMVTICPFCQYAWWASTFSGHFTLPVGIAAEPTVDYARKFAHAVLTGRKNNYHVLDRAMLALNGYWCAQECHYQLDKWLALAIQELAAALAEQNWTGNRARYHYILAELLRRQGQFAGACAEFDLVDESANLSVDLINRQKQLAVNQKSHSVLLTDEEVAKIFFPELPADLPPEMFGAQIEDEQAMAEITPLPENVYISAAVAALPARKAKTNSTVASTWNEVQRVQASGR
jgi:hypothetical protein